MVLDAMVSLPPAANAFSLYLQALGKSILKTETLIPMVVNYFSLPFIYLVVGFGVIAWARPGVERAARAAGAGDADEAPQLPEIEAILIAVLGVYFLCDGFTDLVRTTGWIAFNVIANGVPVGVMAEVHLVAYGIAFLKLGIGIFLILRREGVVALRRRIPEWVGGARRWRPFQDVDP